MSTSLIVNLIVGAALWGIYAMGALVAAFVIYRSPWDDDLE
jgi:hypothetical protein